MWCRLLLRDQLDSQVAGALADPRRATESARAVTLQRRTLVHVRLADAKLVGDQLVVVLRVGDRGLQQLEDVARCGARRVGENRARLVHVLAADVVDHEAGLARRAAHVLGARANGDVALGGAARGALTADAAGSGGATTASARSGLLLGLRGFSLLCVRVFSLCLFGLGRLGLGLLGLGLFSLGLLGLLGCRLASALRLGLLLRLLGLALLRRRALGLGSRLLRRGLARALRLRLLLGGVVLLLLVVSH